MTTRVTMVAALALLVACQTSTETATTSAPTGPACTQQSDCTTEQVCAQKHCQALFPHDWQVTIDKAEFQEYADDGNGWDTIGSAACTSGSKDQGCAPDGQARIYLDGKLACDTGITTDSYTPTWGKTCTLHIDHQTKVEIKLTDHDTDVDTVASDWTGNGDALAFELRNRTMKTDAQNPVFLTFSPL